MTGASEEARRRAQQVIVMQVKHQRTKILTKYRQLRQLKSATGASKGATAKAPSPQQVQVKVPQLRRVPSPQQVQVKGPRKAPPTRLKTKMLTTKVKLQNLLGNQRDLLLPDIQILEQEGIN